MVGYKRKAATGVGWVRTSRGKTSYAGPARTRVRARVVPGYTRTAGFYGRYSGRNAELKFFDGTKTATVMGSSGTIFDDSLNEIVQGVTESNRIGRKCTIRSLHMRGSIVKPVSADITVGADRVRIIVYLDKQANGATAAITDIVESASTGSFLNLANSGRFRMIYDKIMTFNTLAAAGDGTANDLVERGMHWAFNWKCMLPIEFSSTTGAIGEIKSNNIGVLCFSDNNASTFAYNWRIRFSDQ